VSRPDGYLLPGSFDANAIVAEVARGFRVTVEEIMGTSRQRRICMARAFAMAVVRRATNWSWQVIGDFFLRDPSTVRHNVDKVLGDANLSHNVDLLIQELTP